MTLSDQIIIACKTSKGLTRGELSEAVGRDVRNVVAVTDWLVKRGRLHRSGTCRAYRFFTFKLDADAWALIAEDVYVAQLRANKEATRTARNDARRKGTKPTGRPAKPKVFKNPPEVARKPEAPTPAPEPVSVIMPESVKVYVAPTTPSRFHFDPPPGWVGEISKDWMDRRTARSAG
jgi:hypothetical protein